jgi:hypothetical protein
MLTVVDGEKGSGTIEAGRPEGKNMTNGFEEAQGHRNWLERLGDKIPGFKGYQDRELRRDVDRM